MAQIKALFLDRDDTIIYNVPYMNEVSKIRYLPGVFKAVKTIQNNGYSVFIVTNQSGLSRGLIKYSELEAIHLKIRKDFLEHGIRIKKFYISPYIHKHPRRKPGPNLLKEASRDFRVDLKSSIMIGDGLRDVKAGFNAGLSKCFRIVDKNRFWEDTKII